MEEFYKACDDAMESATTATAVKRLHLAHDLMMAHVRLAKVRLELRLVADLWEHLKWTVAWVIYKCEGEEGKRPCIGPWICCGLGTTYVYPPSPTRGRTSLDYRWGKWKDLPETVLPGIAMHTHWPVVRDKTIYEFAR